MKIGRKNIKLVSSQQTITQPPLKRVIPVCRSRRARPRIQYYKVVCEDCDVILSIQWQRVIPVALPNHFAKTTSCPFCNGNHPSVLEINQAEYQEINLAWDLDDLQAFEEDEDSNVIRLDNF